MFPPFPTEEAHEICCQMIEQLQNGIISMEQITPISQERFDSGVMLGVLVCKNSDNQKVVLKTISGISKKLVFSNKLDNEYYVEPIVNSEQINKALEKNDLLIHQLTDQINQLKQIRKEQNQTQPSSEETELIAKRNILTTQSLKEVYSLYNFTCIDGQSKSLFDICGTKLPPTGTGDCCAVKLLDFAYKNNLVPVSLDEVYYGKSTTSKENGKSYPPCDERCGILLPHMLGLHVLYKDDDIVVVNKQSGLLSVPGRGPEKQDCIVNRVKRLYPDCINQPSVHRLDMETSGILVLGLTEFSHRELSKQFERGEVQKEYIALIDGIVEKATGQSAPKNGATSGEMELYFRVDLDNRPHQMWDAENGKNAITKWEKISTQNYVNPLGQNKKVTRILFTPITGRTHQLRLAAADIHGLAMPIIGDTLYGTCLPGERLMLHARYLCFTHPVTNEKMEFICEPEF